MTVRSHLKGLLTLLIFFSLTTSIFAEPQEIIKEEPLEARISMEEGLARKIALNLRDMDIIDVLKFLAQKGNLNIVTSRNVSGRVTLTLSDVSIGDVLDIILISNGLAWRKKNNIIYVMTEEEYLATYGKSFYKDLAVKTIKFSYVKPRYAFSVLENLKSQIGKVIVDEASGIAVVIDTKENLAQMEEAIKEIEYKLETRIFDLKYAKAEDVQTLLSQRLDTELVGNIQADRRSNQVIVRALPERLKEVEEIIKMLDKKTPQVLIETRIFKITLNPRFDMGINWEKVFSKSSHEWLRSLSIVGSFPISSEISTPTTIGTVGKFTIGKVNEDEFTVELKALKQVSDVKILANPRVLVTDNEEASIHIGEKLAYVTTTTTTGQTTTTTAESVTFVDVGIQLKVTPTINPDGFVRMKIAPEISSKFGDYTTPTGNKIPLINTTRAETVVMVKDGTTVIIGGLRKNEKSRNLKGIPLLMNLPLLGRLFRTESESMINAEIVIFLTPHIVSGDVNVTDAALEIKPFKDY